MPDVENIKKISEFEDKSLLIVDDDNPLEKGLQEQWKKKAFKFHKQRV